MLINLSKENYIRLAAWARAYMREVEAKKGPFKNNKLYDKELEQTRVLLGFIEQRIASEIMFEKDSPFNVDEDVPI